MPRDIYPMQYGEQQCGSGYGFGPCIRNNFFIHYVYRGKGQLEVHNNIYNIRKGQIFVIYPGQSAYYVADDNEPWLYRWIEFNGGLAYRLLESVGISEKNPVIDDNSEHSVGKALREMVECGDMEFEKMMCKLWKFIAELISGRERIMAVSAGEEYVRRAENHIKINIHKKLTVKDVADFVGIDKAYLSRLFKQYKSISTKQYMTAVKLDTAALYLKNKNISIKEAAVSVGYPDQLEFSKAFKGRFKSSPAQWRKTEFWEQSVREYNEQ